MKKSILTRIFLLYTVFTMVCSVADMAVYERRIGLFRIWYIATALLWIIYTAKLIVLLVKLYKSNHPLWRLI